MNQPVRFTHNLVNCGNPERVHKDGFIGKAGAPFSPYSLIRFGVPPPYYTTKIVNKCFIANFNFLFLLGRLH